MTANWSEPPPTEPTATPDELIWFASPIVWPSGIGKSVTVPFCQITGWRPDPKTVVAHVPTTAPASFAEVDTHYGKPMRFVSPTMPPFCVHENA